MQFTTSAWSPPNASGEVTRILLRMLHTEPVVRHAIRLVQYNCLSGGVRVRFGAANVPPTPSFAKHIDHYYFYFCRDAIEAMLTVGFVPYRLRWLENGACIPEVLPLGTYSWYVARQPCMPRVTSWCHTIDGRTPRPPPVGASAAPGPNAAKRPRKAADGPILRYEVTTVYIEEPVHVYEFDRPHPFEPCNSMLAGLMASFLVLNKKRDCMLRADMFNSQPSLVFEQQEKSRLNDVAKSGAAVLTVGSELSDRQAGERENSGIRQDLHYNLIDDFRDRSNLPAESVALIAPANHSVHGLDRVLSPQELAREELAFARNVALAVGLPEALVMHGYVVPNGSSTASSSSGKSSSGNGGWTDSAESNNRQMLNLCRHINTHLEILLGKIYAEIYCGDEGSTGEPQFQLAVVPTCNLDQLMTAFNSRLLDDETLSAMLESTWGAPLGAEARSAREELRKAEYVLPFRDKKDPPGAKKKK